jgi:hypothetical protein
MRSSAVLGALGAVGCGVRVEPEVEPPGADEQPQTEALEAGAELLQGAAPVHGFDLYLVEFHPMARDPMAQLEGHHYCRQVNEDFAQCVVFDGNTRDANLIGVEYVLSERLFAELPEGERRFWHPHDGEILSGQLIAPELPAAVEMGLMRTRMNSYGKMWNLWQTGHFGMSPEPLPLGEPELGWSFNRDGEATPALIDARDHEFGVNAAQIRARRQELLELAHPQHGVDALLGAFPGPVEPIPGVEEAGLAEPPADE